MTLNIMISLLILFVQIYEIRSQTLDKSTVFTGQWVYLGVSPDSLMRAEAIGAYILQHDDFYIFGGYKQDSSTLYYIFSLI